MQVHMYRKQGNMDIVAVFVATLCIYQIREEDVQSSH